MTTRATRGPRRRTVVALAVVLAVLIAFVVRLVDIQVVRADDYVAASDRIMTNTTALAGKRGDIVDASGTVLASSVLVYDAQLSPSLIMDLENNKKKPPKVPWAEASEMIAEIIGITGEELREKVDANLAENPDSQYLPIKNGLSTEKYLELRELRKQGMAYIAMKSRSVRVYPNGAVAGTMVGFLNGEGEGVYGVERMAGQCLSGENGSRSYQYGKDGVVIPGSDRATEAVAGGTLQLTLNADLNWYLQQMIAEETQAQGAQSGTVLVVEVGTGKIRAAAEYPSVDPNDIDDTAQKYWKSQIFSATFEPGSTFKAVTAAAVIDAGAADWSTTVTAASRENFSNGAVVNDPFRHPQYTYTLAGALIDSSNVALSKYGTMIDPQTRHDYLDAFGVGHRTAVGFPGEESGVLHPVDKWDNQSLYATTFGQFYTITAAKLGSVYQTIANDGERIDLSLIESCTLADGTVVEKDAAKRTQVVDEDTARQVQTMLENVAVQGSLSERITIDGYRVATKTGTAQTSNGKGGYKKGIYDVSIVGYAPADDPQYVVVVTMDEPTRMRTSAATASAFQKAMTQVMKTYRVAPSTEPLDELLPKFG